MVELSSIPSEFVIFHDSHHNKDMCICLQSVKSQEADVPSYSDITYIRLDGEQFPSQTFRSKKFIHNAVRGSNFFLANNDEFQIMSWVWIPGQNCFVKVIANNTT